MHAVHETLAHIFFDEIWNQKRLDKIPVIFSKECLVHVGKETWKGRDQITQTLTHWQKAFPDMTHQIDQIVTAEDRITVQWHGWGTHEGVFWGMRPTLKPISYHGITIFKLENDKVVELWIAPDMRGILEPLKSFSDKVYTKEDFSEDFQGPAAKIYAFWMEARTPPCARQICANALRELESTLPTTSNSLELPPELIDEVALQEILIPTRNGKVRACIYLPKGHETRNFPFLLYFHGGGWTTGLPEATDFVTRKLCRLGETIVVSVDYRLAPEHPFPEGLHDCLDAYKWIRENGKKYFSANQERVAVAGDSAGGNLAATVVIAARNEGYRLPDASLMLCPLTDFMVEKYPSMFTYGYKGLCYDYPYICFIRGNYARYDQLTLPEVSPMYGDLKEFCPAFVLTAGHDPLYDDNFAFVDRLREAGNHVEHVVHEGMPHGYYYFPGFTQEEDDAFQKLCRFLRTATASSK